jgi:hypothetical protein
MHTAGCFAAYDVMSIDELSERTTGRLGDIRPDTTHAIGGTAEPRLRILRRAQALLIDDCGPAGAAVVWATPHPPGPQDRLRDYWQDGAADAAAEPSALQDLSRDYGPTGSSGRHRRLRRGRSTFRGTTGRTDPSEGYA